MLSMETENRNPVKKRLVTECPVCDTGLYVSELSCPNCQTRLSGAFAQTPLAQLTPDQQAFVLTFVRCRGIIRDVERTLGISYPTVRARLDGVARALDALASASANAAVPPAFPTLPAPPSPPPIPADAARRALLEQVAGGLLDPAEAAEALRRL